MPFWEKVTVWLWPNKHKSMQKVQLSRVWPEWVTFVFWGNRKRITFWHSCRGEGEAEVSCVLLGSFTARTCTFGFYRMRLSLCPTLPSQSLDTGWSCLSFFFQFSIIGPVVQFFLCHQGLADGPVLLTLCWVWRMKGYARARQDAVDCWKSCLGINKALFVHLIQKSLHNHKAAVSKPPSVT